MSTADRRPVIEWLARFDRSADVLSPEHRDALRSELLVYLDEVIPPDASDAEVADVLDRLGDPRDIVDEELVTPRELEPRRSVPVLSPVSFPRIRPVPVILGAVFVIASVVLGAIWVFSQEPTVIPGEPTVVTTNPAD